MRRTAFALPAVCVLLGLLAGCGSDTPKGTLTKDQVSDQAKVLKWRDLNGQVMCQPIEDAEDQFKYDAPYDPDDDPVAATVFSLGSKKVSETVESSVWETHDPKRALERVADAVFGCAAESPDDYRLIESVKGFPGAVAYDALYDGDMRRIFVPIKGHVVVVGAHRENRDGFTVKPEALLKDAVAEAKKVD